MPSDTWAPPSGSVRWAPGWRSPGTVTWRPFFLGAAVAFWIAGFDIIYSCMDVEFDREPRRPLDPRGLRRRGGPVVHACVPRHCRWACWRVGGGAASPRASEARVVLRGGGRVRGAALLRELGDPSQDLSKVGLAFMTMNSLLSICFFLFTTVAVVLDADRDDRRVSTRRRHARARPHPGDVRRDRGFVRPAELADDGRAASSLARACGAAGPGGSGRQSAGRLLRHRRPGLRSEARRRSGRTRGRPGLLRGDAGCRPREGGPNQLWVDFVRGDALDLPFEAGSVRCLHGGLRNPQRTRCSPGLRGDAARVPPRRARCVPGDHASQDRRFQAVLRALVRPRRARARPAHGSATASRTVISRPPCAASPTRSACSASWREVGWSTRASRSWPEVSLPSTTRRCRGGRLLP